MNEEERNAEGKMVPLDLARGQIKGVVEGKPPIVIPGQHLRNMRVLAQTVASATTTTPTIITTNILQSAVLKQDTAGGSTKTTPITNLLSTTQVSGSITIQRPAQITLAAATTGPVPTGTTYHVPRGPAVVANLAAPRSNVAAAIRAPMVVTAQTSGQAHAFVRPPRTPSPAQGAAWLTTNSTNGGQIKGAPTVLSSPVRGATVTGLSSSTAATVKPQLIARSQPVVNQTVGGAAGASTIRPTAAILHSAITIGQGGQLHQFKPGQSGGGIQALTNTVTIAQVLPSRTQQTMVYSASGGGNSAAATHFTPAPRLTVASALQQQQQGQIQRQTINTTRPVAQVSTTRLSLPTQPTAAARLVAPQATVLTSAGARISTLPPTGVGQHQQPRLVSSSTTGQPGGAAAAAAAAATLGRLQVTVANSGQVVTTGNILGQTRISTLSLHPLVAVANSAAAQGRGGLQAQGAKVIAQPTQGTAIHLAQIPAAIKTTHPVVTTTNRTINVQPGAIMTQRTGNVVSTQSLPIAKVIAQGDQNTQQTANVFIHTPVAAVPRRPSPGPQSVVVTQQTSAAVTTAITTYTLANSTYFYETTGNFSVARSFTQQQQPTTFTTLSQQNQQQQMRSSTLGIVATNQQMRFNPVMVMESNRTYAQETVQEPPQQQQQPITKITSSPRPSILRKRDHEGSPLKAAKNLAPLLANLPQQQQHQQPPVSPPSRPDSRGNGHSSGGSTTISATSSPGLGEGNEDSIPHVPMNINKEEEDVSRPPLPEMSPRKKPRKQQLTGNNDLSENNGDMQFITESNIKKEDDSDGNHSDEPRDGAPEAKRVTTIRKPASASLLNSYRQNWKATHNHYLRYSDVRPKDERRPTIMDLANQYRVMAKVNGWKIHHLSTQMEDLADQEDSVHKRLSDLLKCTESEDFSNFDKDLNRVHELIKGNLQRIKIINDGMIEAKAQIMKIFDHKVHVTDIINRCASKRNFKKREKS